MARILKSTRHSDFLLSDSIVREHFYCTHSIVFYCKRTLLLYTLYSRRTLSLYTLCSKRTLLLYTFYNKRTLLLYTLSSKRTLLLYTLYSKRAHSIVHVVHGVASGNVQQRPHLKNVFFSCRMCLFVLQNVFSSDRMCSLPIECVLLL